MPEVTMCQACKAYVDGKVEKCLRCSGDVTVMDIVEVSFAVSEKFNTLLLRAMLALSAVALFISAGITYTSNGSFLVKGVSGVESPRGSMFLEVGFALWVFLFLVTFSFINPPATTDLEKSMNYLGFTRLTPEVWGVKKDEPN